MAKGKVLQVKKGNLGPEPYGYIIEAETGEKYFAHMGDIEKNTSLLYDLADKKHEGIETLNEGDEVNFEPFTSDSMGKAINVKKISNQ